MALTVTFLCGLSSCSPGARESEPRIDHPPPESRFVNANGMTLEVLDWGGEGPNLVLIHGAGTSPHYFDGLAPALTETFRVVSFARRAHGRSTTPSTAFDVDVLAEDLRQVMDSLQMSRASLLGHSFGGGEITRFAALYPDRVQALVYLDAHYERFESPWADADDGRPVVICAERESLDEFRSCVRTYNLPGLEWTAGWEALIRDMVVQEPGGRIRSRIDTATVSASMPAINFDYRREYELVEAPVLVLMAETFYPEQTSDGDWNRAAREWHRAKFFPARDWTMARFREAIPDVEIEILPGTAHFNIIAQDPGRLLNELTTFLSRAVNEQPGR